MYETLLACFVWFVVFILGLVVFLLLLLITIIACIWWTLKMIFNWKSNLLWISKTNLVKARKEYLEDAFPNGTATFEYTIVVPMLKLGLEIVTAVSVLYCARYTDKNSVDGSYSLAPSLVVFHGVGSSATLIISSSIAALREKCNVYVIDIPGFGTSDTAGTVTLADLSADDCLQYYEGFFEKLLPILRVEQPIILAHSIGAFLVLNSIKKRKKEFIGGLILVNPAGILPTLGHSGAYWAILFYFGLPMSLFRILGPNLSSFLLTPVVHSHSLRTAYWLQLQGSNTMTNISKKFICMRFRSSYWAYPQLNNLLNCEHKVGLIWGAKDDLMPIETGRLIMQMGELLGKKFYLETIASAGHSPFHLNGGTDFVAALNQVVRVFSESNRKCSVASSPAVSIDIRFPYRITFSTFSTSQTQKSITNLHTFVGKSVEAQIAGDQKE